MIYKTLWILLATIGMGLLVGAMLVVVVSEVPFGANLHLLGLVAFPVVGGLVLLRRPENRIGKMLVVAGFWFALVSAAQRYFRLSLETGPIPGGEVSGWVATWASWPGVLLLLLLVASFPSGRVASSWLRWLVSVAVAITAVFTVAFMIVPEPTWLVPVTDVFYVILFAVVVVDLVRRWRSSAGIERLQMRWLALGVVAFIVLVLGAIALQATGVATLALNVAWMAVALIPVSIAIAVLRYRLYAIDRLISRTVTYTLVIGLLGLVFSALAIGFPQLVDLPERSPFLVAASTLAVAALFNPLRRRLQGWVDRRFNRARYDAQREVELFAERLRADLDLDDLGAEMLRVVTDTMEPAAASLWIREED